MKRYPRILYFVKGSLPSTEALEAAEALGPNLAFRNATFVPTTGSPEKCDGVAGDVPELYKDFPTAEEALEKFEADQKAALEAAKQAKAERAKQAKADAEDAKKKKAEDAKKPKIEADKKPTDWKANA